MQYKSMHDIEQTARLSPDSRCNALLNTLRRYARERSLIVAIRKLRQLFHFGPWRVIPIYLIRKLRPVVDPPCSGEYSLLGSIDEQTVARELRQNSMVAIGQLPQDFIAGLRTITDRLPFNEYPSVFEVSEDIRRLVNDPKLLGVVRAYLKCEPVLLESSLIVSRPEQDLPVCVSNLFHFDYAGWESLNVFLYLSDVTENSPYHVVAKCSHRNRSFKDVLRGPLTVEEGARRFGDNIEPIQGAAGTLFFENTEAYHRRHRGNERRVMLNLLYASHRGFSSHGRASQELIEHRNRQFAMLGVRAEMGSVPVISDPS